MDYHKIMDIYMDTYMDIIIITQIYISYNVGYPCTMENDDGERG